MTGYVTAGAKFDNEREREKIEGTVVINLILMHFPTGKLQNIFPKDMTDVVFERYLLKQGETHCTYFRRPVRTLFTWMYLYCLK